MKVTLHIGAHFAQTPRLVNAVSGRMRSLMTLGTFAPGPAKYRKSISSMLKQLDGMLPTEDEENALLDEILDGRTPQHLLLINEVWSSKQSWMFKNGGLYSDIGESATRVSELFARHDLRISMALRNPAQIANDAYNSPRSPQSLDWFLENHDPRGLNWLDPITTLQQALPDVPLLLWCEEDAPMIWPEILRNITDIQPRDFAWDTSEAAVETLTAEGAQRLQLFLEAHPPQNSEQFERVVFAFLDKYTRDEISAPVCTIPNWSTDMLMEISQQYEEDVAELSQREGLTFLLPETDPLNVAAAE